MTTPSLTRDEPVRELPVGGRRLWAGVLIAPIAWTLMELVGYYLASRSCEPRLGGVPLAGSANPRATQIALDVASLVAGAVGLSLSVGSWRALQSASRPDGAAAWGRAHFLALVGILGSVLFMAGIVMFGLPAFLVNACSQAR